MVSDCLELLDVTLTLWRPRSATPIAPHCYSSDDDLTGLRADPGSPYQRACLSRSDTI